MKMKILFTSTYSYPSISGVWNRVETLALELIKQGHEVYAFTSNLKAGTYEILPLEDIYKKIKIYRFPVKKFGSKNAYDYDASQMTKKLKEIKPDFVDCQTFRHPEGAIISNACKKAGIPCILTTHAPFVSVKVRGFWLSLLANIYDRIFAKKTLKNFKKIIAITNWEIPYLKKLCPVEKIEYIPNPIPNEFFTESKKGKNILFLGRIAPVKDLETAIKAIKKSSYKLIIIGPAEQEYKEKIIELINQLNLQSRIVFKPAVYDLKEKIRLIDSHEIFILPSKREGLPVSLIEAMARGKLVLSSKTQGGEELIENGKNGFLFEIGNHNHLAEILNKVQKMPEKEKSRIKKEVRETAENFKLSNIIKKYNQLLNNTTNFK